MLQRPLTADERSVIDKCVNAYNSNGAHDLVSLVIGSNFRVSNGRPKGYAALFPLSAKVKLDLIKTGEFGKGRVVYRVKKTDANGEILTDDMFRNKQAKAALVAAIPQSVEDVARTFGAHAVDDDGMFVDQDCVATMGDDGAVGVAKYTKLTVAEEDFHLIVGTVVPQALAMQADAHIDEAVRNGLTFEEALSNKTPSSLPNAMGTTPASVFGLSASPTTFSSSQYVTSRCGAKMAKTVVDALGLAFEEADVKEDIGASATAGKQLLPRAMAEAFTNHFVPIADGYVAFYCDMVNTDQSPTIPFADHALTGWRLAFGLTPELSHDIPTIFKATAFGNPNLMNSYPFSAAVYCDPETVPDAELALETIDIDGWRDPASSILAFDGPTMAISPSFNVGVGLRGDSLELAADAHEADFARVNRMTRSEDDNNFAPLLRLRTCVMRVASVNPLDRPLYVGDSINNAGELAAANAMQSAQ